MTNSKMERGFSLVEILVALFVVSLAAVNIAGLQKMVGEQNRDNFIHSTVLKLATEKMEEVLQFALVTDIEDLTLSCPEGEITKLCSGEKVMANNADFTLNWNVTTPDSAYAAGANVRKVQLQIAWNDSKGDSQAFTYSEQVNLAQLLNPDNDLADEEAAIIESFLETNEVIYFEPKMGYKKDAFVIYNSELFQALQVQQAGNGHPRDVDNPAIVNDGWKSYGPIDNPALAENPDLATLFLDPSTITEVTSG